MALASSPRGSGTWPVERRRRVGGPDAEAVGCVMVGGCATDDGERSIGAGLGACVTIDAGCGDCMSTCCATEGRL
eukprot:261284-Pleurochrysis_carterae.AAC.1